MHDVVCFRLAPPRKFSLISKRTSSEATEETTDAVED